MSYRVKLTRQAEDDLLRLLDLVIDSELGRPSGGDLSMADKAISAIGDGFDLLRRSPFTCRKANQSPFLRELIIPFGNTGYVALFEITSNDAVEVAAVRHQREDDYH